MKHPNALMLEKLYADFAKNDLAAVLAACPDQITFQIPGKSKIAGKYDKKTFASGLVAQLMELSGGTFKLDVHDIMASDRHGIALGSDTVTRDGKTTELRTVHVWRFENGKPVAFYEYPRDIYQFDLLWS